MARIPIETTEKLSVDLSQLTDDSYLRIAKEIIDEAHVFFRNGRLFIQVMPQPYGEIAARDLSVVSLLCQLLDENHGTPVRHPDRANLVATLVALRDAADKVETALQYESW